MLIGYNEVHSQVMQNLLGSDAGDFEIQSVERNRPGGSLHQGASLWIDAPAGAAPRRKTGTRLCKPQHWTFSPEQIQEIHPVPAHTGKRRNGHRPKDYFRAETADSLTQLRSGGQSRQDFATKFLKETTDTGPESFFK